MTLEEEFIELSLSFSSLLKAYRTGKIGADYYKLSLGQFSYLRAIAVMQEPSLSELAAAFKVTKPAITLAVGKLVALGFVTRTISKEDARVTKLGLTPLGVKIARSEREAYRGFVRSLKKTLSSEELASLQLILGKVIAMNLTATGDEGLSQDKRWLKYLTTD